MALNECFDIEDRLLTLDEAHALIAARIQPVEETETLPLSQALGRVLAEDVVAPFAQPSSPNSAMDGFAVCFADLLPGQPTRLWIGERIAAGHPRPAPPPGQAAEIFTGAPLPAPLDTVAMVEDCPVENGFVTLPPGLKRGNHVRPAGEDFTAGAVVLRAGRRLLPPDIAMAAAVGRASLPLRRRLKVGVFSTGDEVVEPGGILGEGQLYGSNRPGQLAMVTAWGHEAVDLGHLPDQRDATAAAFLAASGTVDAILSSGGVSMGGEDHVRDAVLALGGELHLWRIALKPGKPVVLGRVGQAAFIGLPGYPVSALVTMMLVARVVLNRLSGASLLPPLPPAFALPAGEAIKKKHNRRTFLRASLRLDAAIGTLSVVPYSSQDSGVISSLVETDGLIDLAADNQGVAKGELVSFRPYGGLMG